MTTDPPKTTYDRGQTKYPESPPVVVYGPSPYQPTYWHDWYYGQPFWWRMWHRPVYHGGTGWAVNWVAVVGVLIGVWVLLGVLASWRARRRKRR